MSYEIDTTIDGREIRGRATITLTPLVAGVRVLPLHIFDTLSIRSATVESDKGPVTLSIVRDELEIGGYRGMFTDGVADADAAVVFPEQLTPDKPVRLHVEYHGCDVLECVDGRCAVRARQSWYPNLGTFSDLATYELTFRFPRRNSLVSWGDRSTSASKAVRKSRTGGARCRSVSLASIMGSSRSHDQRRGYRAGHRCLYEPRLDESSPHRAGGCHERIPCRHGILRQAAVSGSVDHAAGGVEFRPVLAVARFLPTLALRGGALGRLRGLHGGADTRVRREPPQLRQVLAATAWRDHGASRRRRQLRCGRHHTGISTGHRTVA